MLAFIYSPIEALVIHIIMEIPSTLFLMPNALKHSQKNDMFPMFIAMAITIPLGMYLVVLLDPQSNVPMIGASGAIAGLLGSYIVLHPKAKIYVFAWIVIFVKLIKVPAFIVISIWIGLQFMNVFDQGSSGVAYSAHIGGFLTGLILTPFFKKNTTKIFTPDKNKLYISKNISEELDKDSILRHMPSNKKKERKNKNPWDL